MSFRTGVMFVLCLVLVSGVALASPSAKVTFVKGDVMVTSPGGGAPRALKVDDVLNEGDIVDVPEGGILAAMFEDGADLRIAELSRVGFRMLAENGRTIDLHYGRIVRFDVKKVTTGIVTPLDAFAALFDGVIRVEVDATNGHYRAQFNLLSGSNAKVVDGKTPMTLGTTPVVILRDAPPRGTQPVAAVPSGAPGGQDLKLTLGMHTIYLRDKSLFTVEKTSDGGAVIKSTLPPDQFGVVMVDNVTALYLSGGQSIRVDAAGNISELVGGVVVHVYGPLTRDGLYIDPVSDAAQASFTSTRIK